MENNTVKDKQISKTRFVLVVGRGPKYNDRPNTKRNRKVTGRCPKCDAVVQIVVSGRIGEELCTCTGCGSSFGIDQM